MSRNGDIFVKGDELDLNIEGEGAASYRLTDVTALEGFTGFNTYDQFWFENIPNGDILSGKLSLVVCFASDKCSIVGTDHRFHCFYFCFSCRVYHGAYVITYNMFIPPVYLVLLRGFSQLLLLVATVFLLSNIASAQQRPMEVNIGAYILPGSPSDILFKEYAVRLNEAGGGELTAKLMIYGEGGSEEQMLAALRRGRLQLASISSLVLSTLIPELEITKAPFLFESIEEFNFVLDAYLLDELQLLIAEKNLKALRWLELGGMNFYGKKPILWPKDVKDQRMRASSDIATRLFWEAVDADPIFLGSPDVVPALQTGLLDGGAAVALVYGGTGVSEQALHYTVSNHFFIGALLMANKQWIESLSVVQKVAVTESFATNNEIRNVFRTMSRDFIASAAKSGVILHRLTPAQRVAWINATKVSHRQLISALGGGARQLYDVLLSGKRAYAARRDLD